VGRSLTPGVRRNRAINLNYYQKRIKQPKKAKTTTQQSEEILQSNKITEKKLLNQRTTRAAAHEGQAQRNYAPGEYGCKVPHQRARMDPHIDCLPNPASSVPYTVSKAQRS